MKTTLISVSISCILGLSLFGEAANVPKADKPELGVKSTVNRPTHIIKLKASNIGDFKGICLHEM
jgi:hypothetical protein